MAQAKRRGMQLKCSHHAKERIKERLQITDKKEIDKLVKDAFKYGLCGKRNYVPKETYRYIMKIVNKYYGRASQWRIYNNSLFLFAKNLTLLTVIKIPSQLEVKKEMVRIPKCMK